MTKVEVRIGNKVYTDTTIIAGQWNVTIDNLMPGDNLLDLYAYHSSNDSGCDFVNT
ncbi:MAG: hypothetical protein Q8O99_07770 [bacterium]|nr:hypothetical protein [bacterium]